MEKELIIVGIDPGTTSAYAVLSMEGRLIATNSRKDFEIGEIIGEIIGYGKPVVIGSDKMPCPALVKKIAAQLKARLIWPKKELTNADKRELVGGYADPKNPHERDALAGAAFSFKVVRSLLKKIDLYAIRRGKESIKEKIIWLVLKNEKMSIKYADALIQERMAPKLKDDAPEKQEQGIDKKELFFMGKIRGLERENKAIKEYNAKLKEEISDNRKKIGILETKAYYKITDKEAIKLIGLKEQRIRSLSNEIEKSSGHIKELEKELDFLKERIMNKDDFIASRAFNNLSWRVFKDVRLKHKEVILVDEPNVWHEKAFEKIKSKDAVVLYKKQPDKSIKSRLTFVDSNGIDISYYGKIAFVDKKSFEKKMQQTDILGRIIDEYKSERIRQHHHS